MSKILYTDHEIAYFWKNFLPWFNFSKLQMTWNVKILKIQAPEKIYVIIL